ncbi:MAG: transposase [Chloracidobacterium sp.]|nr:transposase [Chloracidobacterium sp.]
MAFVGLDPLEKSSGETRRIGSISKARFAARKVPARAGSPKSR